MREREREADQTQYRLDKVYHVGLGDNSEARGSQVGERARTPVQSKSNISKKKRKTSGGLLDKPARNKAREEDEGCFLRIEPPPRESEQ